MHQALLRYVALPLGLAAAFVAGGAAGSLWPAAFFRSAVAAEKHPGMVPISLSTPVTEKLAYPPGIAVEPFDGAYKLAKVYLSGVYAGNKVAFWESEAGALRSANYPQDEFIYVLEGTVVTTDEDGTRREFHAGDVFVLPKGWAGVWDMKNRFKKIIVNF
jgi:uncharacterized cupin superfamily protein